MKKLTTSIELTPVKTERGSAQRFARIAKEQPHNVARSRFIPPRIGAKDFGSFEVEYRTPLLREAFAG